MTRTLAPLRDAASTGPRARARGNISYLCGRISKQSSFNGAARARAEIKENFLNAHPDYLASTGPRARARGNFEPERELDRKTLQLQRGRARARAEIGQKTKWSNLLRGFNGAARARARKWPLCYSFWRNLAILQLRPPALFALLLCSYCLVVSSLFFHCKVVTSCERQREFSHHLAARRLSCQRSPMPQTT